MNRRSEIVTAGAASIETYVDGHGPAVAIIPSYGRDGGEDFDFLSAALMDAGYRVLRPQPRGVARSVGPMSGVGFDDMAHDIAAVIDAVADGLVVILGHALGNFVARATAVHHPDKVTAVILAAASGKLDPFHHQNEWADLQTRYGDRITSTVITDASHALFPEQPDAVAASIIDYVREKAADVGLR
jgi:pimeloyl-ACP methyl ester carboxylesterase